MTTDDLVVLAQANMLGRICGSGVNGAGTQLRVLLASRPAPGTVDVGAAVMAGFESARSIGRDCKHCGSRIVPSPKWGWIHPPNRTSCCNGRKRAEP